MNLHLENARRFLEEAGVDALLLTSRENKFYTAGLYSGSGYVLVTRKLCRAIVDGRYYLQQKERMKDGETLLADSSCGPMDHINRALIEDQVSRLGFEQDDITFRRYEQLKASLSADLVPVSPGRIRMKKDETELSYILKACEIADRGYEYILTVIKAGMTEKQVENQLLFYMKSIGAQKEAFDIIVAGGFHGAMPHAKAGDKVLEAGDFVTMDFGARYGEYCSDITRTVAVGYAAGPLCQVYEVVRQAQAEAFKAVKPGSLCREVDKAARDVIASAGFLHAFTHNLGHGLGICCHEGADFSMTDTTVLEPGMVMTVEPGIYLEGIGGVRIEDDVLVTDQGCQVLTTAKRDLTVVG